jgi:Bacterial pre-peptidase C-terminal domain
MSFAPFFSSSIRPLNLDTTGLTVLPPDSSSVLADSLGDSTISSVTASSAIAATDVQLPPTIPDSNDLDQLRNDFGSIDFQGTVGSGSQVFYRWTTSNDVSISLTDIPQGRDVDLQLLNSVGEEIAVSANPGNSNESIHLTDLPPDTYIIGVSS